jgi:hypothetical protein
VELARERGEALGARRWLTSALSFVSSAIAAAGRRIRPLKARKPVARPRSARRQEVR